MNSDNWIIRGGRLPLVHFTEGEDGGIDPGAYIQTAVGDPCQRCENRGYVGDPRLPVLCPACSRG